MPTLTLTDRLAQFFTDRPSQWVDGRRLSEIAGAYAWRTRISNCRQLGMTIENRVRVVQTAQGQRVKISEYRYVEPKGQGSLFSASVVQDKVTRAASVHVVGTSHD